MSAVLIMLIVLAAIFIIWVFYPGSTKEEKLEEQKFEEQKPVESHKVEDVVPTQECIIACQDSEKPDDCIIECHQQHTLRKRSAFKVSDE